MSNIIKSISYDQTEIINNIIRLYIPTNQIDVDCTYSKGNFYNNTNILKPKYKFDILPQYEYVQNADCRNLPLENNLINSIMFDPPFLATKGGSLLKNDESNLIIKRFGNYETEVELHQFYIDSLKEFYRILNINGILIFKCQDKISSGKQYLSHCFIIEQAQRLGFYCEDIFILLAKSRIIADWQRNQQHSRKFHSYFLVFRKINKIIKYIKD